MLHTALSAYEEFNWEMDRKVFPFWRWFQFVYPGISRRAGGVSVGINLTPDRRCNFNCIYCEVDRRTAPRQGAVDLSVVENELRAIVRSCRDGELFQEKPFDSAPERFRRLRYITFSGDGEPTASPLFAEAAAMAVEVRDSLGAEDTEVVLITDSAGLRESRVRRGLEILRRKPHQIWAKLDAGTEQYYQKVNRSRVPFGEIVASVGETAREYPLYVQSLFMKIRGEKPGGAEIDAYCGHLENFVARGGRILGLQLNTIARRPAESWATPLANEELDEIAARIKTRISLPQQLTYSGDFHVSRQALAGK